MKKFPIAALLSFNSGFVDTVGYFGLQGLFAAHVTGNFVTMGSTLVFGTHGIVGKVLVVPEFIAIVALTRWAGLFLTARNIRALRPLLALESVFLAAFFWLAVTYGPFNDADAPLALAACFAAVAAMAVLNAVQRAYLADVPPITIMTGNTTQVALDAVDLLRSMEPERRAVIRLRFLRTLNSIVFFAFGCAVAILLHVRIGFKDLAIPLFLAIICIIIADE